MKAKRAGRHRKHSGATVLDTVRAAAAQFKRAKLAYGHGTTSAFDEAAFLVLETLGLPIDRLDKAAARVLSPAQLRSVDAVVHARIKTRKPAPYLTGRAYIHGIPFHVDERVIVPRSFIGELLMTNLFSGRGGGLIPEPQRVKRVLDLCTGSGCLAVLAAKVFPKAKVDAVELSAEAATVARRNIAESGMTARISLIEGDLYKPLKGRRYDLIIANPPYVDAKAMRKLPREYRHEPALALAGGKDGLDLVRRIVDGAAAHLTPNGALLCEIGSGARRLSKSYPKLPFLWLETAHSSDEVFWLEAASLAS